MDERVIISVDFSLEVTRIYSIVGKSEANPSKNVFEREKIGQEAFGNCSFPLPNIIKHSIP
jgi:hypothetical protein